MSMAMRTVTDESLDATALPPRIALKIALFWSAALALAITVILVKQPIIGALSAILATAGMGYAVVGSTTWPDRRAWPHAIAAVIAALSAMGLCATKCGTYAYYDHFLGIPTGLAAVALHGSVALIVLLQVRAYREQSAISDLAIAIAIGGSLFYGSVLIASGTWCGACFAIHALMAVQLIELVMHRRGVLLIALVSSLLTSAGLVNAVYHHHPQPSSRNDADALLAYLRSGWTADDAPARLVPEESRSADGLGEVRRAGADIEQRLQIQATPPGPAARRPLDATPLRPPVANLPPESMRALGDANRWGAASAPVTMLVAIDTGCPVCAQEFGQILDLEDLVEAGRLQVRFLITYKNDASQATASIAYVAGLLGEHQLIGTLQGIYAHFHEVLTAADALKYLPAPVTAAQVVDVLRHRHDDISGLLADAAATKERLGATGDPAMWLLTSGSSRPLRTFQGLTMSTILRLGANSLDPAAEGR
jgi:hypothetical protein